MNTLTGIITLDIRPFREFRLSILSIQGPILSLSWVSALAVGELRPRGLLRWVVRTERAADLADNFEQHQIMDLSMGLLKEPCFEKTVGVSMADRATADTGHALLADQGAAFYLRLELVYLRKRREIKRDYDAGIDSVMVAQELDEFLLEIFVSGTVTPDLDFHPHHRFVFEHHVLPEGLQFDRRFFIEMDSEFIIEDRTAVGIDGARKIPVAAGGGYGESDEELFRFACRVVLGEFPAIIAELVPGGWCARGKAALGQHVTVDVQQRFVLANNATNGESRRITSGTSPAARPASSFCTSSAYAP